MLTPGDKRFTIALKHAVPHVYTREKNNCGGGIADGGGCGCCFLCGCGGGGSGKQSVFAQFLPQQNTIPEYDDSGIFYDWTGETGDNDDAFGNIMHKAMAKFSNISYAPLSQSGPSAYRVRTTIDVIGEEDEEEPIELTARLVYSVNDGDERSLVMTTNGSVFTAYIPAQASGSTVRFYIKIRDQFGNVTSGAFPYPKNLVRGVEDMDNSVDIVPDDLDLLETAASYDDEYLYVKYTVQGNITGGTMDPPYIQIYRIKRTNPDIEQTEGLMVGKLWIFTPLAIGNERFQEIFYRTDLFQNNVITCSQFSVEDFHQSVDTGMLALDIGKVMAGNYCDGYLISSDPQGTTTGNTFIGKIKKNAIGAAPSNYVRIIVLTAVNASLDAFMPIPLNCSHFLTLHMQSYSYTAQ